MNLKATDFPLAVAIRGTQAYFSTLIILKTIYWYTYLCCPQIIFQFTLFTLVMLWTGFIKMTPSLLN